MVEVRRKTRLARIATVPEAFVSIVNNLLDYKARGFEVDIVLHHAINTGLLRYLFKFLDKIIVKFNASCYAYLIFAGDVVKNKGISELD